MRRGLFNFAALVSLILCMVSVGLWRRSYRAADYLVWAVARDQTAMLVSHLGELEFVGNVAFDPRPGGQITPQSVALPVWRYATAVAISAPLPLLWFGLWLLRFFRPKKTAIRNGSIAFTLAMLGTTLAAATTVLWVRSSGSLDELKFQNPNGILWIRCLHGEIAIAWRDAWDARNLVDTSFWNGETHQGRDLAEMEQRMRLELSERPQGRHSAFPGVVTGSGAGHGYVVISLWLPLTLALAYPIVCTIGVALRRVPRAKHLCDSCGYNLTGNTSGTCPECGTPVPRKPEAAA